MQNLPSPTFFINQNIFQSDITIYAVKLKIGLEFERANFKNYIYKKGGFYLSDIFGFRSEGILALSSGTCPLPGVIFTSLYPD